MIKINNLTFSYDDNLILKDFNLCVEKGVSLGIKGKSGSGKTTILRLIAGLEKVKKGEIFINGKNVNNLPTYKRNVGFIFQTLALFPHLSVKKNVLFGIDKLPKKAQNEKLEKITKLFEIDNYIDRFPHELSQGQRQRVAIARSIICSPDIILFDEPFSSLDADIKRKMRIDIKNILKTLEMTSIIVSHDEDDLKTICDKIIKI